MSMLKEPTATAGASLQLVPSIGTAGTSYATAKLAPKRANSDYAPARIRVNGKEYIFNYPLQCLLENEDGCFVINSEQLDIIGTGLTQAEAQTNFNEEFDYLYSRLNSLEDEQISGRMLGIKSVLNDFVREVL